MQLTALRQAGLWPCVAWKKCTCNVKILLLFATVVLLQSVTPTQAQSITLNLTGVSAEAALQKIKEQSDYRFVYTREQLEGIPPVNAQVNNVSIEAALKACFKNSLLDWVIEDKVVVFKRKSANEAKAVVPNERMLKGVVNDGDQQALAGVTVEHLPSTRTTVTDSKGAYKLFVPEGGNFLFSYVGFHPQQVAAKDGLIISLAGQNQLLDETVVIAYGTTTRRLNTGSINSVKSDELSKAPVTNPIAVLQGRVAGLQINQKGGLPGAGFDILVRGKNSIQNGVSPLIIIDGVPFIGSDESIMQRGHFNANSPFATINPKDIESIEVLKDADATAIYGSRGANGVILITTKGAKHKGMLVSASVYRGTGKQTRVLPYMGLKEYLAMRREAFANDGVLMTNANAPDLLIWDTTRQVDWRKEIMGERASFFNSSLSIEAGGENLRFALRANYNSEGTIFPGEFGSRGTNVSMTTSYLSNNKKLGWELGSSYAHQRTLLPLRNMGEFLNLPPNAMAIYDSAGKYNWSEGGANFMNPLAVMEQQHLGVTERIALTERIWWQLVPSLQLSLRGGLNGIWFDEKTQTPIISQRPSTTTTGSANYGTNQIKNWSIEPQIEFNKTIGADLKLSALTGLSFQGTRNKLFNIAGSGYTNDALLGTIGGAGSVTATNDKSEYRYQAVFFRTNLQWRQKYLMNLTGRRDGSSRFGPNKRFANFGAIGAGWIFSKEKWFAKTSLLSFGKLRGSYGITGNDQIKNYQYLDAWVSSSLPYQGLPVIRPTKLFNPDYSWEQIRKKELGLELGLLKDRIFTTLNYFQSRSDNQIVNYPLPTQTGFANLLKNFPGVVENKGVEILLETVNIKHGDLKWRSSFNISFTKNRLVEFPLLSNSSYKNSLRIGKSLNSSIGYVYTGIDTTTGTYSFKDLDADGLYNLNDKVWIGSTDPQYYGGLSNHFKWKGFDLDILFEFKKQSGNNPFLSGSVAGRMVNVPAALLSHWAKIGGGGPYQVYSQQSGGAAGTAASLMSESSGRLTDASYIRMKNVHVGYRLPKQLISKLRMRQMQIYLEAQNLITWTNFAGADPENQGLVGISPLRVVAAGIHVQF